MSNLRQRVLSLYRQTLQLGRHWEASSGKPQETAAERKYILNEARTLFRKNKNLTSEKEIVRHIQEAEARIELALHYKNPYPRPIHFPQNEAVLSAVNLSTVHEKIKRARSSYVSSLLEGEKR